MEEAKAAIKKLTSHHGNHDTTVHEHHKPSVTHEHVTPTRHDEGTTVVDREVHQDHYHTNVQPIHDREVLPEQHKHKLLPTEEKEYRHGDANALKQRLAGDAAQFKDATETGPTQFTKSTKPEVGAEHVHHHIHETIQPVIQKETIQLTVVHTTKPIHEVHHNAPQHHAATVLPAVNLADFQKQGGSLTGAADRTTHHQGEPGSGAITGRSHNGSGHHPVGAGGNSDRDAIGTATNRGPTGRVTNDEPTLRHERPHEGHSGATVDTAGITGTSKTEHIAHTIMDPRVDQRKEDLDREAAQYPHGSGQKPGRQFADTHIGAGQSANTTHVSNTEAAKIRSEPNLEKKKPSLIDKLNPLKDADGDGKQGIGD